MLVELKVRVIFSSDGDGVCEDGESMDILPQYICSALPSTAYNTKIATARNFLAMGFSVEQIAQATQLPQARGCRAVGCAGC